MTEFSPQHVLALAENWMRETEVNRLELVESCEREDSVSEEAELFSELTSTLHYAVSVGFCTEKQAQGWIVGYEDCGDRLDWKRNILRVLQEECMPSGERQQGNIEEVLNSPYLPMKKKLEYEKRIAQADTYEREEILEEASKESEKKQKQEDEFNQQIFKIKIAGVRRKLEQEFILSDSEEAKQLLVKLDQYINQPVNINSEIPETVKNKVTQSIQQIEFHLTNKDYASARQQLETIGSILNFSGQYKELSQKIDGQQTDSLRQMLKAA